MLRIQVISRLVVGLILLAIPLFVLLYHILSFFVKSYFFVKKKYDEIKALSLYKQNLLKKLAYEDKQVSKFLNDTLENKNLADFQQGFTMDAVSLENTKSTQFDVKINFSDKELEKQKKLLEKIQYEALLWKDRGNAENYEKKLIEGLAVEPNNFDFMKLLADFYFSVGNHVKALSLLKKILEKKPDDHKAIWQIGEIYLAKGEFDIAELLIEKAIALKPNDPKYYVSMVEIKYNTHRKEESVNLMEKVIKLRPSHVGYLLALAKLYEEIADYQNAKKYYFRILEFEPTHSLAKQKVQSL